MHLRLFFLLNSLAWLLPLACQAQVPVAGNEVVIYELPDQHSQKQDANRVSPAIIPGVERQFYCLQSKTLYIEVAASQARQCESYLNNRGIICLLKKNCSLATVEEKCSIQVKAEN